MSQGDASLFEGQIQQAIHQMTEPHDQEVHILSSVRGWNVGEIKHNGKDAMAFFVLLSWSSLDAIHDEKRNDDSTFNNLFATLQAIAPLGMEKSLYMNFRARQSIKAGCAVM